jgi:hypothetical protein
LKLLLDHNLAPRLARCLQALFDKEHEIVALGEKFPVDVADLDWIKTLDQEGGWAVLTKDLRLRTRPHERAALDRSRIVYFFLAGSWRKYKVEETAARLIRLVPLMAATTKLVERGRFELPVKGVRFRQQRD